MTDLTDDEYLRHRPLADYPPNYRKAAIRIVLLLSYLTLLVVAGRWAAGVLG